LVLYVLSLALSELGTGQASWQPGIRVAGGSGAITAVLFASIVYHPEQSLFILPIPFPIPGPLYAILFVAYSWYSARQNRGRINHDAHLGGALVGLAFVLLTDPGAYSGLVRTVLG
jgi:membrane associated rhomboid family serine protease